MFDFLIEGIILIRDATILTFPYFVPFLLSFAFLKMWYYYLRLRATKNIKWVMLEIKLPEETYKSPKAMETILTSFYVPESPNFYEKYIEGDDYQLWSSLEIVSLGGRVHFFIRIPQKFRTGVEAAFYAQYQGIEIFEAEDYIYDVPYLQDEKKWHLYGIEFKLKKADSYPIKTYEDYGLEKDPKEEFKIDPMASVLETLGALGPDERAWIQILITPATKRFYKREDFLKKGKFFSYVDWTEDAAGLLKKLMKRDKGKDAGKTGDSVLSPGERDVVKAIERNISKLGFDCGIRALYMVPGVANPKHLSNQWAIFGLFKQYNTINLNGFKFGLATKYPRWKDPAGLIKRARKRDMFHAYINRGYFFPPFEKTPFVLNVEELATIYHFPGRVAEAPMLKRIQSKKSEPPINLPR